MAEVPIESHVDQDGQISRRNVLKGAAVVTGFIAIDYLAVSTLKFIWRESQQNATEPDKHTVDSVFYGGTTRDWDRAAVFPGIIVISSGVEFSYSMFGKPDSSLKWPGGEDNMNIAVRPFVVRDSLRLNSGIYEPGVNTSIKRVLPDVPRGLLGMWLPGETDPIFFDADKNMGLITAYDRDDLEAIGQSGKKIIGQNVTIGGREERKGFIYPYLQELDREFHPTLPAPPQPFGSAYTPEKEARYEAWENDARNFVEVRKLKPLGHTTVVSQTDALNTFVEQYLAGQEPYTLPKI